MAVLHLDVSELAQVASNGAGLTVSASALSPAELSRIARSLSGSAVLHVIDSEGLSAADMSMIVRGAHVPAYVSFS